MESANLENLKFDLNALISRTETLAGRLKEIDGLIEGFLEAKGLEPPSNTTKGKVIALLGLVEINEPKAQSMESKSKALWEIGLPVRVTNILHKMGVERVIDLCKKTPAELAREKGFGRTALRLTRKCLEQVGLSLHEDKNPRGWRV